MIAALLASLAASQSILGPIDKPVVVHAAGGGTVVVPTDAVVEAHDRLNQLERRSAVAQYRIAALRSDAVAAELGVPRTEFATLALAAAVLDDRDRKLRALLDAGKEAEFLQERAGREKKDMEAMVEALGQDRGDRIDQLVLHFNGPRWSLFAALSTSEPLLFLPAPTEQDVKVGKAMGLDRAAFFRITTPIRKTYLETPPEAREKSLAVVRMAHDAAFLKALTPTQRAAWEKFAGPKPKMRIPRDWPHLREGLF